MHCKISGSVFYYSSFLMFKKMLSCFLRGAKIFQIILHSYVFTVFPHSFAFVFIHFSTDSLGVYNIPGNVLDSGKKMHRPCPKEVERLARERDI